MAIYMLASVLLAMLAGVSAGDICSYELYPDETRRTTYCSYGCCYTMIYPCCIEPFYVSAAFIAPMVVGCVGLLIVIIVVIIVVRRRRLRAIPMLQYTTPVVGQQIITTNGGVVNYPAYGNNQYIGQPMYQAQPAYGTTPVYTLHSGPGVTTPMMAVPNEAPPVYEQVYENAPPHGAQSHPGTNPEPTKKPLQ